ncbi:MAG: NUDIX domain-containing protein [Candidatus Lokiarchaeota archaeon]|nr:NUDIX domain-containing protein [Candidatus Lokiarchaeota archaeon]
MVPENFTFNDTLIKERLIPCYDPQRIRLSDKMFVNSAVLFSIIPYDNRPYDLIIIHRTNRGRKHRGEMSFPGGKFDPSVDQTLLDTAIREAMEEIGVSRDDIEILGCLNDFPTMTKYIISPFVAKINPEAKLIRQEREVQEILKVPIDFFINKINFQEQAFKIEDKKFPVFYFTYENQQSNKSYLIWGATAFMIVSFIERIYGYEMSELGIKRFKLNEIVSLKDFIRYRDKITSQLNNDI